MKKIPFNIKYKQDIIDGKVKVFTKNGSPVEIVYWNLKNAHYDIDYPILAVVNGSSAYTYTKNGTYSSKSLLNGLDLVIEVPEPKFKEPEIIIEQGQPIKIIDIDLITTSLRWESNLNPFSPNPIKKYNSATPIIEGMYIFENLSIILLLCDNSSNASIKVAIDHLDEIVQWL